MSVGEPDLTELGGEFAVQTAASLDLSSQEDVSREDVFSCLLFLTLVSTCIVLPTVKRKIIAFSSNVFVSRYDWFSI